MKLPRLTWYNTLEHLKRGIKQMTISEKIRILARRKGINLSDLAAATNQSHQNLNNKLRRNNWTEEQTRAAAAVLGCTVETVFTDQTTGEKL